MPRDGLDTRGVERRRRCDAVVVVLAKEQHRHDGGGGEEEHEDEQHAAEPHGDRSMTMPNRYCRTYGWRNASSYYCDDRRQLAVVGTPVAGALYTEPSRRDTGSGA
jgi:hypothetical protein